MSRRRVAQKREILPDPKFNSLSLSKFINIVMQDGKKSVAESIVYGALDVVSRKLPDQDPLVVFNKAIDNCKPLVHVKSRRVGGATYQVPVEIAPAMRTAIAFRWVRDFSRKRGEKTMVERLAAELMDAFNHQGTTIKRKDDTHRMAEANKAFAHFRY
jgi:small subunit ribosomal protein S7